MNERRIIGVVLSTSAFNPFSQGTENINGVGQRSNLIDHIHANYIFTNDHYHQKYYYLDM